LITIVNFVATFSKLTGPASYSFWEIHVKSTLALITYPRAVFTANDILNASALPQTTGVYKIARRNFLRSQALAVLNFILLDNLLMHGQPNAETLWAHLWNFMETYGPASIFADYQRTIIF